MTAIGHSTFLLQIGGLNILTDPVFGERASPLPFAGPRRRHPPGLALDALPPIDLVLQSHDHYDHLDDAAVRVIARTHPAATWCAPLGVAARLRERGVREIVERDWWDSARVGAATVTCVPAAHFSGRAPYDRDRTLWSGWAVSIADRRIYFVGDSGFHPVFPEIGDRLGPCDMVFMPIGAYEPRWFMKPVHLDPDEALEAFDGLTRPYAAHETVMVAMHWGTFPLTDEPMDEPPRRTQAGWAARGWAADRLWILNPGETRAIRSVR
ncbi:MAG: MBL fold metallo-hydrolase [Gemmatimonadaceae bacterium]